MTVRRAVPLAAAPIAFALLSLTSVARAQLLEAGGGSLNAANLLQYQIGRDPTQEEQERTKLFEQLVLEYTLGDLRVGLRAESFRDSVDPDNADAPDYDEITQKYIEWSTLDARLRVGNGYAILGRGLLFRAFELPGVVRTAMFPAAYYGESRDLEGAVLEGSRGPFALTALSGRPVIRPESPHGTEDTPFDRRRGAVSGAHASVALGPAATLGGAYVRTDDVVVDGTEDMSGVDLHLRAERWLAPLRRAGLSLELYGEYAGRRWRPFEDGFTTHDGTPHALYTATQLAWSSGGLSFESKRYHQFDLTVNDPPTLVPELGQLLLNRATHVLLPRDETGVQLAVRQGLPAGWTVETVWASARNRPEAAPGDFDEDQAKHYRLAYGALESDPLHPLRGSIFAASGKDQFESVQRQRTFGARGDLSWRQVWGAELEAQHQHTERPTFPLAGGATADPERFDNFALIAGLSRSGWGRVALAWERSNDRGETDDPFTPELETRAASWLSGVARWEVSSRHEATLTVGERRGGLACTSGTCYVVPDFRGAELRVISRF